MMLAAGAAQTAAQTITQTTAQTDGPTAADCEAAADAVLLVVDGFRNREGTVRVELWPATDEDFLRNHHELVAEGKPYHRTTLPVPADGPARVCVPLPVPGTYALGAFHSPAGVRKFDYRNDGATFTRNPRLGLFKTRPRAKEVAVTYGEGHHVEHVTLAYLKGLSFRPVETGRAGGR